MTTLIATIFFCLGWRIVTDEGQLLYFIRKPFERNISRLEVKRGNPFIPKKEVIRLELINYFGKPFVLCITCMASIWGATIFIILNGFAFDLIPALIWNSFAASFIQTFIWKLYAKLD